MAPALHVRGGNEADVNNIDKSNNDDESNNDSERYLPKISNFQRRKKERPVTVRVDKQDFRILNSKKSSPPSTSTIGNVKTKRQFHASLGVYPKEDVLDLMNNLASIASTRKMKFEQPSDKSKSKIMTGRIRNERVRLNGVDLNLKSLMPLFSSFSRNHLKNHELNSDIAKIKFKKLKRAGFKALDFTNQHAMRQFLHVVK